MKTTARPMKTTQSISESQLSTTLTKIEDHLDEKYLPKLRDIQRDFFKEIQAKWNQYDVFVFHGPVASGKSVASTTLARWRNARGENVAIITPKVMLQDQYTDEFTDIESLKGRARYSCHSDIADNCNDRYMACESYCSECPYVATKENIAERGLGIFNFYSYMLGTYEADVLIIDEAHNTFDSVSEIYTKYIYKSVENYGNVETMGDAIMYLDKKSNTFKAKLANLRKDPDVPKKELIELAREIDSIDRMIYGVQQSPKDFFFEKKVVQYRGKDTEALRLTPLTLNGIGKFLFGGSSKIVLMSGTFNHIDLRKLGLSGKRILEIGGASPIPIEKRPVIYIPVANMSYKTQDNELPKLAEKLIEIAQERPEKGLVHVTYAIAEKLKPYLKWQDRFIFHTKTNKDRVYQQFRSSDKPLILVASGMSEGIDLPYDAGRWQVITKVQYPSLQDGLMSYIKDNEKDLYAWLTVRTLVQQCGRICRTPEDYGITYILDTCFENLYKYNKKLFPGYFKDSVTFKRR